MPFDSLVIIGDEMVFSVYGHEFYSLAKYLQSVEKLDTFTDRHIGIYRTV